MLDLVDKTLYQMPLTVEPGIILPLCCRPLMRRNNGLCATIHNLIDKLLCRVTTVCYQALKLEAINQVASLCDVMTLSGSQRKPQWITQCVRCYVDFRAESTPAASKRLAALAAVFFGAPAAQGCARIMVLSTSRFSMSGSSEKCAIMRSQTPLSHQRAKRLYTLFQFPYSSGKNRHWAPLLNIQSTPSMKRRHSASLPTYTFDWLLKKLSIFDHFSSDSFVFMSGKYPLMAPNVNTT
jgi:hypothetical protein